MAAPVAQTTDIATRVVTAATQGAVGAVVGASLSAVTEPIVNKMLVERLGISEAVSQLDLAKVASFFNTMIMTNFIKFPFFEVTNVITGELDYPPHIRGAITGAIFCTLTLPITNYRFAKSMNLPVEPSSLYKAYLPTVLRDIVYGMARNWATQALLRNYPDLPKTTSGKFILSFLAVMCSCIVSAPMNEVRGYYLQPKDDPKRPPKSPREFFQPERFIRSTSVGAVIMSTALGTGMVITGPAQDMVSSLRGWAKSNTIEAIALLFALHQVLENGRSDAVVNALKAAAKKP